MILGRRKQPAGLKISVSFYSKNPLADLREGEVLGLMNDVAVNKSANNKDDKALSAVIFKKLKNVLKEDLATAIKEALDAQYLDEKNPEIEAFIEKAELRALTR